MGDTTVYRGWTIPTQGSDPWYAAFLSLINEIDADMEDALEGDQSLDGAYDNGAVITADDTAVGITVPIGADNTALELTQNDTTNNPSVLKITNPGSGFDITTATDEDLKIVPGGTGTTIIGNAGTPSHSLSNDDLFVSGKIEADGLVYLDSYTILGSATSSWSLGSAGDLLVGGRLEVDSIAYFDGVAVFNLGMQVEDDKDVVLGSGAGTDTKLVYSTAQTVNTTVLGLSTDSNHIVICQRGDAGYDFAHAQASGPTVYIQSANQSATEWLSLTHDQTDGLISSGTSIKLAAANNKDISFITSGTGMVSVGVNATSQSLGAVGDLFVAGRLEVDSNAYFDATTAFATFVFVNDDALLGFGTPGDAVIQWNTTQTPDTLFIGLSGDSRSLVIAEFGDYGYDFAHAQASDPTVYIQSANQSATEWLSLAHNQTDGVLATGAGALSFTPADGIKFDSNCEVVAESYTNTSGNIWSIKATPAASGTATLLRLEADGTNWSAGEVIRIVCDDTSTTPFVVNNGSSDRMFIYQNGNIATAGTITLTSGGTIATSSNGSITLLPNGSGITIVGDASSTSHTLNTNDDLFVAGRLEIDGTSYFDGSIICKNIVVDSSNYIYIGTSGPQFARATGMTGAPMFLGVEETTRCAVIGDQSSRAYNWSLGNQTNPTLFVTSANESTTEWLSLAHDQTDGLINVGTGNIKVGSNLDLNENMIKLNPSPTSDDTSNGLFITDQVDVNAFGQWAALHIDADGNWIEAHADAAADMPCQGLAIESGTGSKKILLQGFARNDGWSWGTVGGPIYVSDTTSGGLTQTQPGDAGEQVQVVGWAMSATIIYFNPSQDVIEVS